MSLPAGTWLRRLVRPWLPATVSVDVLDPAVADLQYEAEHAQSAAERRQVILRGYVAIVRALVLSIEPGAAIRTAVALFALCGMGTLLVTTARAARVDGRLLNSAIFAPVMLAPVILRVLGTMASNRLFVGSLTVAMLTTLLTGGFALHADGGVWILLRHTVVALILFAPMAAAAAIVAGPDQEGFPKRAVTAVSFGSGVATAALLLARWPQGEPLSIGLAMTPFYVVLFAVLFTLTLLPSLLVARMFVARPAVLAIVGLGCSPATLIAGAYIDHRTVTACLDALRNTPVSFAAWSVPFVTGAITVGWRLPPSRSPTNLFHRS
jgi:hypothetical protein